MATKQEKAVQRAVKKERKLSKIRGEKRLLWFLVALILILLYLLLAQHKGWWPYSRPNLGTAFYTNVSPDQASASTTSGSAGTAGSQGSSGSSNSGGGSSGSTSTPPATTSHIAGFAADVNVGDTKAQTSGQANGLVENCALVVSANASTGGQQEVCTYTQGDKIVTVTYLNDHVVSASKSGF